jgi:hypothetical protein
VEVVTDLNVTGKPAQFGRGVMQDVSDKLLGQFVDCLESRVGPPPGPPAAEPASAPVEPATPTASPSAEPVSPGEPRVVKVGEPPAGAAAIDLGTTVLPVLAKTYWKQVTAALGVLVALRWLRRRR